MNCSVAGGYVYRGTAVPDLVGSYVFGDFCTGGVFAVRGSVDIQGGVIYRITDASLP